MSLRSEIESYRAKIIAAQEALPKESPYYKSWAELPKGFYKGTQLEKFQKSDPIITKTIKDFFNEMNFPSFSFEKEFREQSLPFTGSRKEMFYLLHLGEDSKNDVYLDYEPGGKMSLESLGLNYGVVALVPPKKKKSGSFEANELIYLMNSPESNTLVHPLVRSYGPVTHEVVRDLLILILANPKYNF